MKNTSIDTITFIPSRLNKLPTVYRGLTVNGIFLLAGLGALFGVFVGVFLVIFIAKLALIPTFALGFALVFVYVGSIIVSAITRNKPEGYLERKIDLMFRPSQYITVDRIWSIKRTPKPRGKK